MVALSDDDFLQNTRVSGSNHEHIEPVILSCRIVYKVF